MPLPVWVAAKPSRLRAIHRVWREQWPDGSWLRATDAELQLSEFLEYQHGQERARSWLDDWQDAARVVCAASIKETL